MVLVHLIVISYQVFKGRLRLNLYRVFVYAKEADLYLYKT